MFDTGRVRWRLGALQRTQHCRGFARSGLPEMSDFDSEILELDRSIAR